MTAEEYFKKWWTPKELPKSGFNKTAMLDFAELYAKEYHQANLTQKQLLTDEKNGLHCNCEFPLIRTGTPEYCGNCENDILNLYDCPSQENGICNCTDKCGYGNKPIPPLLPMTTL